MSTNNQNKAPDPNQNGNPKFTDGDFTLGDWSPEQLTVLHAVKAKAGRLTREEHGLDQNRLGFARYLHDVGAINEDADYVVGAITDATTAELAEKKAVADAAKHKRYLEVVEGFAGNIQAADEAAMLRAQREQEFAQWLADRNAGENGTEEQ